VQRSNCCDCCSVCLFGAFVDEIWWIAGAVWWLHLLLWSFDVGYQCIWSCTGCWHSLVVVWIFGAALLVWIVGVVGQSVCCYVSCQCCFIVVDSLLWSCWCGGSVVFSYVCHCVVSLLNVDAVFVMSFGSVIWPLCLVVPCGSAI